MTRVQAKELPDDILDASDVGATLSTLAEAAAGGAGEWALELVGADEGDFATLARLLEPLTEGSGEDLAAYLVATQVPSSAGYYKVAGEGEIHQERGYQGAHMCRLLASVSADDAPMLYVAPVRVVAQDDFVLVNWRPVGGYPEAPDAHRLAAGRHRGFNRQENGLNWPRNMRAEGPRESARIAGVAEEVLDFEYGLFEGSSVRLGRLRDTDAAPPSAPRHLAENFISRLASSMNCAAQECGEALQAWEAVFLSTTVEQSDVVPLTTPAHYQRLAGIANLVSAVRAWTEELNSPASHAPLYWFGATPDSNQALHSLESADRRLDAAREDYRTALSVAAGIATSQQLELQSKNQAQGQAFERTVALAGSIVLVPGLVATFYGANVPVPAGATWWGTALVLALMVVAGCGTWMVLSRGQRST